MLNSSGKNTALMVFSLSADREAERKRIFGEHQNAASAHLFDALIQETAQLSENSGLDVVWFDENKQKGTNFASRFTNAFQDLFDAGYDEVISIGNDCPDLQLKHIRQAQVQLQQNEMVLGPAFDGGVYLFGLSKSAFDAETLQKFPWEKSSLYHSLTEWGKQEEIRFSSFEILSDLDHESDLLRFWENNPQTRLGQLIAFLIQEPKNNSFYYRECWPQFLLNKKTPARAPPMRTPLSA